MDNRQEIIAKIKKLLALSTSSNEHEAKLAAEKAAELLTRYNLSQQDVVGASYQYVDGSKRMGLRATAENKYICNILQKFFFVVIFRWAQRETFSGGRSQVGKYITIVGKDHNVEIAIYVHDFLQGAFRRCWKDYKKSNPSAHRTSYYYGLYVGLVAKLEASQQKVQQQYGLVLKEDKALIKYADEKYDLSGGKTQTVKVNKRDSEKGIEDAKNINIYKGVGTTAHETSTAIAKSGLLLGK